MLGDRRENARLSLATVVLVAAMACNPVLVRWAYEGENIPLSLIALLPATPLVGFAALTIWQTRNGKEQPTFAPGPLTTALSFMASWLVGSAVLGYFVVLLGAVVLPVAAVCLAIAWVQPTVGQRWWTVLLAIAAVPLAIWFAGRADEYVAEAAISGSLIVAVVAALGLIRHRRFRAEGHGWSVVKRHSHRRGEATPASQRRSGR